jgi:hypothetical protein
VHGLDYLLGKQPALGGEAKQNRGFELLHRLQQTHAVRVLVVAPRQHVAAGTLAVVVWVAVRAIFLAYK